MFVSPVATCGNSALMTPAPIAAARTATAGSNKPHVSELTELLRQGPAGDQLTGWPSAMRVFARRERPHPGAQLTMFEG